MNTRSVIATAACVLTLVGWALPAGAVTEISGQNLTDATISGEATVFSNAAVDVLGDLTLDGATIVFNSDDPWLRFQIGMAQQSILGDGTLHLQRGRPVRISFGHLTLGEDIVVDAVTPSPGYVRMQGEALTNKGSLLVGPGTTAQLGVRDFTNHGEIVNEGVLRIGDQDNDSWRNTGTITLKAGSRTYFNGTFTLDDLGTVVDEGSDVELAGILDLEGNTLDLEMLPFADNIRMNRGEIRDGRVVSSGDATLDFTSDQFAALFNNMTLATDLLIPGGATGATLRVANGLTLENVTLTMPEGAGLVFQDANQSLQGSGTILTPNRPGTSSITTIAGDDLVIGEDITIRNGTEAYRELELFFKENHGLIIAEAPGTLVTIGQNISPEAGQRWTNKGTILVEQGTVEFWGNYTLENLGDLQNVGGRVILNGTLTNLGRTLHLPSGGGDWIIDGTVIGGVVEAAEGITIPVGGYLDGVTLRGHFESRRGSRGYGSLVANGTLTLDDAQFLVQQGHDLNTEGNTPLVIDGTGVVQLDGAANSTILYMSELTISPDITLETTTTGAGRIQVDTLINHGTIVSQAANFATLRIDGNLINSGTLTAKSSSLFVDGSIDLAENSLLEIELASGVSTYLSSTGVIDLDGTLAIQAFDGIAVGDEFTLLGTSSIDGVQGQFKNVGDELLVGHVAFRLDYGPQAVTLTVTRVPEPATICVLLVGLLGSGAWRVSRCDTLAEPCWDISK